MPFPCQTAVSRGHPQREGKGSAAQPSGPGNDHHPENFSRGVSSLPGPPGDGAAAGSAAVSSMGPEAGLTPVGIQALRAGPGPCSFTRSTTVEHLLYARPCAGLRGGCSGSLPTPDALRLCTCLLERTVDQTPVIFSFYDEAGLVEEDGGGGLQDKSKKGFFLSQNGFPHSGYFLLSKPEWVRGLTHCMRKNLHLL